MALGGTTQSAPQIAPINPANLIGTPDTSIVEPRATSILVDAFRQGVVTADDIMSRIGEGAQAKKKAELQMAQEFTSPEAQAARAQQLATQTAQGQLGQAQAEKARVLQQYPAVAYFDQLTPGTGITVPPLQDGTPDYQTMEAIGAELAVQQARKVAAQKELDNIEVKDDELGRITSSRYKQGGPVDQNYVQKLRATATKPLERMAPGTVAVEPRTPPATGALPVVESRGAVPTAGTPVEGGYSMGPRVVNPPAPVAVDPIKRAQDLAAAQNAIPTINQVREAIKIPQAVGPAAGSYPVQLGNRLASVFGFREDQYNTQRDLETKIAAKVLASAEGLRGTISDKDLVFLKDSMPKLSDTPARWGSFLNDWERITNQGIEILGGKVAPVADTTTPVATAGTAENPLTVSSLGQVPATAQFVRTPAGDVYKNPNYRP